MWVYLTSPRAIGICLEELYGVNLHAYAEDSLEFVLDFFKQLLFLCLEFFLGDDIGFL